VSEPQAGFPETKHVFSREKVMDVYQHISNSSNMYLVLKEKKTHHFMVIIETSSQSLKIFEHL